MHSIYLTTYEYKTDAENQTTRRRDEPEQTKGSPPGIAGQQVSNASFAQLAPQQNASALHTVLIVAPLQHFDHTLIEQLLLLLLL